MGDVSSGEGRHIGFIEDDKERVYNNAMAKPSKQIRDDKSIERSFNPKLKRMLQILLIIAFIMLAYVIFSSIKNTANPLYVALGLFVGIGLGLIFARMFKISWDDNAGQVAYRMDILGLVLLLVFIVFDFSRTDLVADLISGPSVKPTSFALLAGTFYGRVYGIGHNIISVLREQKILPSKKEIHPNEQK